LKNHFYLFSRPYLGQNCIERPFDRVQERANPYEDRRDFKFVSIKYRRYLIYAINDANTMSCPKIVYSFDNQKPELL
jgi:hypothetical protein